MYMHLVQPAQGWLTCSITRLYPLSSILLILLGLHGTNRHRLDNLVLLESIFAPFCSETTLLDAAERCFRCAESLKLEMAARGPDVSSCATAMSVVAFLMIVGSKKYPLPRCEGRLPPNKSSPSWSRASRTCLATFSTEHLFTNGPWVTFSSRPNPSLS